mmetsp:Transcript_391/g.572  ORF Transcript_391/g.572 Transcript_391/m.572 type:complete len:842 (-) Transcript_391:234-2759(-)
MAANGETVAEVATTEGEERLRRRRAARERARSSSTNRSIERNGDRSSIQNLPELQAPGVAQVSDSRRARARSRQAPNSLVPSSFRRSPSATSRRQKSITRGASREAAVGHELPPAPLWQEPEDVEARWQTYVRSEEYLTFQAVLDCLRSLPPMEQLTDRRVDFEVLLHLLHRLGNILDVEHVSKSYRAHYSPDVQLCGYLYSTLLTAFTLLPSYVLNGQEFYVSDTVLDQCKSLQFVFQETCSELKKQFENLQSYSVEHIRNDVKRSLVYFDRSWCRFEMPALEEIEAIHRQACRPLIEAIEADQLLLACESKASSSLRGSSTVGTHRVKLQVARTRLMESLCELNRLANVEGKGRADMDVACLVEAERIVAKPMCTHLRKDTSSESNENILLNPVKTLHKCAGCAPPVLLRIARSLLRSFARMRRILQRYANCLYQLNSHLANNRDLVRGLELFETSWETGSQYLVQSGPRRLALLTYNIVSGVQDPEFEDALNSLDPGFLVASLPRALILHEMRRFAAARASPLAAGGLGTAPSATQPLKGASSNISLPRIATTRNMMPNAATILPKPLETRRAPSSAFQHSPIARAFLPEDVSDTYNEIAVALERIPVARLPMICSLLVSPPRGTSGRSLPLPPKSASRHPKTAETLPRTPCPPRIAVPSSGGCTTPSGTRLSPLIAGTVAGNTSRQASAQVPQSQPAPDKLPGDSDDEEDTFSIDLTTQIQNIELGTSVEIASFGTGGAQCSGTAATHREFSQDPTVRRIVSNISTMALHLQRTKPHEWNELIQVVLQGFMLVKEASTTAPKECTTIKEPAMPVVERTSIGSGIPRVGSGLVPSEVW